MKVFLDMDGVLVDFHSGACAAHGIEDPHANGGHPGQWDLSVSTGIPAEKFWEPLSSHEFWAGLGWTPEGRELLSLVEGTVGEENVCLLTSPTRSPYCASGKVEWIQREMPAYARRFFLGTPKRFAASGDAILIDDADHNVEEFRKAGGRTCLVPRPWNKQHPIADKSVDYVRNNLKCHMEGSYVAV